MFFDTNALIRARFDAAPGHELARRRMSKAAEGQEALRISRQILREYPATVTRPQAWSPPVPMDDALEHTARLEAEFDMLEDGPAVTDALAALCAILMRCVSFWRRPWRIVHRGGAVAFSRARSWACRDSRPKQHRTMRRREGCSAASAASVRTAISAARGAGNP